MTNARLPFPFDAERDHHVGDPGARAQIVIYGDYTSNTGRRVRRLLKALRDRLVNQAERDIVFAYRHLTPVDEACHFAARAAEAAGLQGRFWDMHEALYEGALPETTADLRLLAEKLGLDGSRFEQDLLGDDVRERVAEDMRSVDGLQLPAAPALYIDGRLYRGAWDDQAIIEAIDHTLGMRLQRAQFDLLHASTASGIMLIGATVLALLTANLGGSAAYQSVVGSELGFIVGDHAFSLSSRAWINDGLMAVFFLLVGIEIKREVLNGELSNPANAALPIFAAAGGMILPAALYALFNVDEPTAGGWGVPMATDIAFTLGLMALLGNRAPTSLKVFVSALAIADDLGAIAVIAIFYGHGFHADALISSAVLVGLLIVLNRGRVYARLPYMIIGAALWFFIHEGGLHATLAGVIVAIAIPCRKKVSLAGLEAQTAAVFEQANRRAESNRGGDSLTEEAVDMLENALERSLDPGKHVERSAQNWINLVILPLFAFINTGIVLSGSTFSLTAPVNLGILAGLCIGKPLGITLFSFVAVKLGWARLPEGINWIQIFAAALLAGVGFTMSIFIATAAFEGEILESAKLTILAASSIAGMAGYLLLLHTGASDAEQTT